VEVGVQRFCRSIIVVAILCCLIGGCDSGQSTANAPPVSAAQLRENFSRQVTAGHDEAALVVAHTLTQRYPESAEAKAVSAQLPELQARVASQKAAAQAAAEKAARETKAKQSQRFKLLLSRMSRQHDDVEHDTFFQSRSAPAGGGPYTYAKLYIGRSDSGQVWLRTRLQYGGDDWIFFERIKFSIDGVTSPEQKLGFFQVKRDNQAGSVWEWVDLQVPDEAVPIFDAMAKGNKVVVRFDGKYRHDLTLSAAAKQSLADMLELYGLMKAGMKP
jgi:hypothetical protein